MTSMKTCISFSYIIREYNPKNSGNHLDDLKMYYIFICFEHKFTAKVNQKRGFSVECGLRALKCISN